MRVLTHARRRAITISAAVASAAALVIAAGVVSGGAPVAQAAAPVPAVSVEARTAPVSAAQKADALASALEGRARAEVAAAQAARATAVASSRARVLKVARDQLGDRYSAGATGPNAFDCSGFTRYVYKVATGKSLPHQSHSQFAVVKRIPLKQAKPGDLVFFFRNGAHHVGIYIGGKKMIDAAGYGEGVKVSPITGSWWGSTFSGVGRILPA